MGATASDQTTVGVGATVQNVLLSKMGYQAPLLYPTAFRAKALANGQGLLATLMLGQRMIFQDRQMPWTTVAGVAFPSWLDHVIASAQLVAPGELPSLSFRNPTAASINVNWEVESAP